MVRETKKKEFKCPLCGYKFVEAEAVSACDLCPKFLSCNLIMCPNCYYEFPAPK